jgi:hypothetical protein
MSRQELMTIILICLSFTSCSYGPSITIPEKALLLRDRNTYVMANVDGNTKVFSATGVYQVAKDGNLLETVIYFVELKGTALADAHSSIKEFFGVITEICPRTSDEEMHAEYKIVSLGWHPPVGQYASPLNEYPTKNGESIATITQENGRPTCRDVRQLAKNWSSAFGL